MRISFASPCPSYEEKKLNTAASQMLADLDLTASGANDKQIEAGYEAVFGGGLLAAGTHHWVKGPGGKLRALDVSEFYLPLQASAPPPEGQMCGGFAGLPCPDGQVCDIDMPDACGGADGVVLVTQKLQLPGPPDEPG